MSRVTRPLIFLMIQYRCPKCNERFFTKKLDINQRHGCGEFAYVFWGFEFVDGSEPKAEEDETEEQL